MRKHFVGAVVAIALTVMASVTVTGFGFGTSHGIRLVHWNVVASSATDANYGWIVNVADTVCVGSESGYGTWLSTGADCANG